MTMTYPVKGEPLSHQLLALQEANLKPAHAFILDAGGGKTFTCIAEAGLLYAQGEIDGLIVLAPNGPHRQWVTKEIPKWAAFDWVGTYNKAPKRQSDAFWKKHPSLGLGVLAFNYEGIITAKGQRTLDEFIAKYPRFYLVIDESQKVKNPKASRTVKTEALARRATHRRILSGTPILRGLEDLFSQYYILQKGITGPFAINRMWSNWTGCRNYYCVTERPRGKDVSAFAQVIVGYKNEQEFRERVRPYTTRVTSDMFMTSEKPVTTRVVVEMSDKQKSAYIQMKNHFLTLLDSGTITAQNALVQMGKLQQITSGYIMDEDRNVEWLSDSRVAAVLTLLEGLDEPTIVWSPFNPLKFRLHEEIEGSILYTEPADVDIWQKKGGVIVGNQGSGLGVGMNLQNAAANIYAANGFGSEARWQSLKRTDRLGQTRLVRNWDLLVEGTVDEKALDALDAKEDISRRNIDGLKEMLL